MPRPHIKEQSARGKFASNLKCGQFGAKSLMLARTSFLCALNYCRTEKEDLSPEDNLAISDKGKRKVRRSVIKVDLPAKN